LVSAAPSVLLRLTAPAAARAALDENFKVIGDEPYDDGPGDDEGAGDDD
jgi:hypothetical protein